MRSFIWCQPLVCRFFTTTPSNTLVLPIAVKEKPHCWGSSRQGRRPDRLLTEYFKVIDLWQSL
jgi:hypothetical protein